MNKQNKYSREVLDLLSDPALRLVWEEEGLLGEFALMVEKELTSKKLSKADLARQIGKSPQAISRALGGGQNLSVRTMLEIALSLGRTVRISLPPVEDLRVAEGPTVVRQTVAKQWQIPAQSDRPYSGARFGALSASSKIYTEAPQ